MFVEEDDKVGNPLGVKGMGDLGMVGTLAAIANAVFHATGKRIREPPITPDKLPKRLGQSGKSPTAPKRPLVITPTLETRLRFYRNAMLSLVQTPLTCFASPPAAEVCREPVSRILKGCSPAPIGCA